MKPGTPPRPLAILRDYGRRYPDAWKQVDSFRLRRGTDVPSWPEWCYVPIAATLAIVDTAPPGQDRLTVAHEAAVLAALAAWRIGQGIYRWHPALAAAVADTPMDVPLPIEALRRLPEWGIYHALLPGVLALYGAPVHGVFAHLEWDAHTEGAELRLVFDTEQRLAPVPLPLGGATVADALAALYTSAERQAGQAFAPVDPATRAAVQGAVALTLYLAAEDADIAGQEPAGNPAPVATRRGLRVFPRDRARTWDVGWRVGAALAAGAHRDAADPGGQHASPRAHLRRAHWHAYWTGPRTAPQTRRLRWVHPVLVGGDADRPAVIHPVDSPP